MEKFTNQIKKLVTKGAIVASTVLPMKEGLKAQENKNQDSHAKTEVKLEYSKEQIIKETDMLIQEMFNKNLLETDDSINYNYRNHDMTIKFTDNNKDKHFSEKDYLQYSSFSKIHDQEVIMIGNTVGTEFFNIGVAFNLDYPDKSKIEGAEIVPLSELNKEFGWIHFKDFDMTQKVSRKLLSSEEQVKILQNINNNNH